MDYELTFDQVSEIQTLNARLVSVKILIKEAIEDSEAFSKLVGELAKTQILYDDWFNGMQKKLNIITHSDQRWNVDFQSKKLQLLG